MSKRILVAGIGNIFMGDDAFGVETMRRLSEKALPDGVRAVDFGIRGHDLAFAMMDGHDVVILVDAAQRGNAPGTLYLLEPILEELGPPHGVMDPHSMNFNVVLRMVETMGGRSGKLYLVGCEPEVLESEDGRMGLSPRVEAAVPKAVELIEALLEELIEERNKPGLIEAK